MGKSKGTYLKNAVVLLKAFVSVIAISCNALSILAPFNDVEIPVVNFVFSILQNIEGFGIEQVFLTVALVVLFRYTKDMMEQKNGWFSGLCVLFAVFTVFGISFMETASWDYVFYGKQQFVLAVLTGVGYYFLYKNGFLAIWQYVKNREWLCRRNCVNKLEEWLFQKHPFKGPLLFFLVCSIPWVVLFWPGTLQWDAHAQLWQYFGVVELTGHHPLVPTYLMGACVEFGRNVLHAESVGFFLYTGIQMLLQCLVFAYAVYLSTCMNVPLIIRWCLLIFYGVYPLFPSWGFTMVKDTGYYLFLLLFILVWVDILVRGVDRKSWYKILLWITGSVGVGLFRNDGRYIVVFSLLLALAVYRKYWKLYIIGGVCCVLAVVLVTDVYMPAKGIAPGATREALSVPMLQVVKYTVDYRDELTEEERRVVESVFQSPVEELPRYYFPENADEVKERFKKQISDRELKEFLEVWFRMFEKHPANYVETFLNHVYGYVYPSRDNQFGDIGIFYLGNAQHRQDEGIDVGFGIKWREGRDFVEQGVKLIERLPVVGMLYSPGLYVWGLLGIFVYMLAKKKYDRMVVLFPAICTVGICMLSPLNACVRYILPLAALLPVLGIWATCENRY